MTVGLLTLEIHLPGCSSLKEKRHRIIRRAHIVSIDEAHDNPNQTMITLINGDSLIVDLHYRDVLRLIHEEELVDKMEKAES